MERILIINVRNSIQSKVKSEKSLRTDRTDNNSNGIHANTTISFHQDRSDPSGVYFQGKLINITMSSRTRSSRENDNMNGDCDNNNNNDDDSKYQQLHKQLVFGGMKTTLEHRTSGSTPDDDDDDDNDDDNPTNKLSGDPIVPKMEMLGKVTSSKPKVVDESKDDYAFGSYDVLTLKGAAAQQTMHPGNLDYYQLCEENFEEYEKIPLPCRYQRKLLCFEKIVSIILDRGGVFRKYNGKPMKNKDAIMKTMDRMRQIAKPKLVKPANISDNDVVFKKGAANHLFPGNSKVRALIDAFADEYYPGLFKSKAEKVLSRPKTLFEARPAHQNDIAQKVYDITSKRGGLFRGDNLRVLSKQDVLKKIHERFKDLKKKILAGRIVGGETCVEQYVVRRSGCTSSKVVIPHGQAEHKRIKAEKGAKHYKHDIENVDDLWDDSSESIDENDNDCNNSEEVSNVDAVLEDSAMSEKQKNNKVGSQDDGKHGLKRQRKGKETIIRSSKVFDHQVSEYESERFEKRERRFDRLYELGFVKKGRTEEV